MNWHKKGNVLILETGDEVTFDFPIKGVNDSSCLTAIGVILDVPLEQTAVENSCFLSKKNGEVEAKYIVGHSCPPNYSKDKNGDILRKSAIDWGKDGETLIIQDKKQVTFDYPVGMVYETCGIMLVVLDVPQNQSLAENIFAVSKKGEVLWQIEHSPDTGRDPANRYTGIGDSSIPGIAVASNWNGMNFYIDIKSGKIVDTEFTK